jgi:hypothetical protein
VPGGVTVAGDHQGDWDRLLQGAYDRPPTVSDAQNMDDTPASLPRRSSPTQIRGLTEPRLLAQQ